MLYLDKSLFQVIDTKLSKSCFAWMNHYRSLFFDFTSFSNCCLRVSIIESFSKFTTFNSELRFNICYSSSSIAKVLRTPFHLDLFSLTFLLRRMFSDKTFWNMSVCLSGLHFQKSSFFLVIKLSSSRVKWPKLTLIPSASELLLSSSHDFYTLAVSFSLFTFKNMPFSIICLWIYNPSNT